MAQAPEDVDMRFAWCTDWVVGIWLVGQYPDGSAHTELYAEDGFGVRGGGSGVTADDRQLLAEAVDCQDSATEQQIGVMNRLGRCGVGGFADDVRSADVDVGDDLPDELLLKSASDGLGLW